MGKLSKVNGLKQVDMTPEMERNLNRAFANSRKMAERFREKHKRDLERLLKDDTRY